VPDTLPRALFLDQINGSDLTDYRQSDQNGLQFERSGIVKNYALDASTATITWQLNGLAGQRFTTRIHLAMPSCDGFLGRYVLTDGSVPGGFGQEIHLAAANSLRLEDGVLGGAVELRSTIPAQISGRPQQTVSQSEAGFEKIMQSTELTLNWTIPSDACTLQIQLIIEASKP
jgi:alpha-amylase